MKALSLCLSLALSLAACGSADKNSPGTAAAAAKANLKARPGQADGVVCPTVNGEFESARVQNADGTSSSRSLLIITKETDGKFSYALSKDVEPQLANGQPVRIDSNEGNGQMLVTCDAESIEWAAQEDGKGAAGLKIFPHGANKIRVEGNGELAAMSGEMTKR